MAKSAAQSAVQAPVVTGSVVNQVTSVKKAVLALPDMSGFATKSSQIRHLHAQGWSRGDIARSMNIKYQHVRNVLISPLKRGPQA